MVKPKDLCPPFLKNKPQVIINDQMWYIPTFADLESFRFEGWEHIFPKKSPIHIEYCSGNGSWIAEKAEQNPDINWVAVEKRFDRSRKIWSKIKNHKLSNLIVVFGDAITLSTHYIAPHSISCLYINFPDPWPKKRHTKHRIIAPPFFEEAVRILEPKGTLIFVTDDIPFSEQFCEQITSYPQFEHSSPIFTSMPEDYGVSFFSSLFSEQGKEIRYHKIQTFP